MGFGTYKGYRNVARKGFKMARRIATGTRLAGTYVSAAKKGLSVLANIVRRRPARARTITTTKRTNSHTGAFPLRVYNKGGGVPSQDTFRHSFKPDRKALSVKKVGAPCIWETNYALQVSAAEGFQNALTMMSYGVNLHLTSIMANVPTITTLGAVAPTRYVLASMNGETVIQNSSLATAYVDIYDIVRKRDSAYGAANISLPETAWTQGMIDSTPIGTASTFNMLKSQPIDCQLFNDYFKVLKRSQICLTQGSVHRHFVNLKYNKFVDNEEISQGYETSDFAVYTLVVGYGQPASLEGGITTTASIKLDTVSTCRYKYTWVQENANSVWQVDNLSTLVGETIVSVGAGAIVPNATT